MNDYRIFGLSLLVILFWASAYIGIRYGLAGYQPGSMALLRYAIASICMVFVYPFIPNKTPLNLKDFPLIIVCGILGISLYNITLNQSEVNVPAAVTSFTISQAPVIATILAILFLGERIKLVTIIGIAMSILGLFLIAYSHHTNFVFQTGILLALISALSASLYIVLQKPLLSRINPLQFVCYAIWSGTLWLFIYLPQLTKDIQTATWPATLAVVYLGVFPATIAYLLWSYLLAKTSVTKSSVMLYTIPVVTMFMGWILLDEKLGPLAVSGGLIALAGAYLVGKK